MIAVLKAIRTRLSDDARLTAFFSEQYNLPLKHLFGFKKALKADDYPILSYVCTKAVYPNVIKPKGTEFVISLVLGINDERIIDDAGVVIDDMNVGAAPFLSFSGAINGGSATELIIDSLRSNPVIGSFYLNSDFSVFQEIPPNVPFFNIEISFILGRR